VIIFFHLNQLFSLVERKFFPECCRNLLNGGLGTKNNIKLECYILGLSEKYETGLFGTWTKGFVTRQNRMRHRWTKIYIFCFFPNRGKNSAKLFFWFLNFAFVFELKIDRCGDLFFFNNILMVHYLYHIYQLQRWQFYEECPFETHISN